MSGLNTKLKDEWLEAIEDLHDHAGDETVIVKREYFTDIVGHIKRSPEFDMNVLMDLTAVDGKDQKWNPRFEVVYHFYSTEKNHRLRVKVRVDEKDPRMPTLTTLWPIANWFEREVWDMFGIRFDGHPNLQRILMYEGFEGHPLRKDYPIDKRQPLIGPKN